MDGGTVSPNVKLDLMSCFLLVLSNKQSIVFFYSER